MTSNTLVTIYFVHLKYKLDKLSDLISYQDFTLKTGIFP